MADVTSTWPSGIWRHAKGQQYLVIGVASDSNNVDPRAELQVVYVSLDAQGRSSWPMHARSLPEFLERFRPDA